MTSRFFARSDSSETESDSDEQNLYSDGEESDDGSDVVKAESEDDSDEESDDKDMLDDDSSSSEEGTAKGADRFLRDQGSSSEDESEDEKVTVVRSAKDKRIEEAEVVVRSIENAVKINDWHIVAVEFDK